MKVGFHTDGLSVAGGGEKYLLSFVEEVVARPGAEAVLLTPDRPVPEKWRRLGVEVTPDDFTWRRTRSGGVWRASRDLDLLISMHHVPPRCGARHGVAIVQFPFRDMFRKSGGPVRVAARRVRNVFELSRLRSYDEVLCYSEYVRGYLDRHYGIGGRVLYPAADHAQPSTTGKRPIIVNVGRFIRMKQQGTLIEAFRQLSEQDPAASAWELHFAGGADDSDEVRRWIAELHDLADGLNVEFHENITLPELKTLYDRASIFWQAVGYGLGDTHPELFEHFGITTVEAMNHGAVPIVFDGGGQPEIVGEGRYGQTWRTLDDLVRLTSTLIADPERLARGDDAARQGGARFSAERFRREIRGTLDMYLGAVEAP